MRKGLYEREEENKKHEEEKSKLRDKVMKKFSRKESLFVEAPKLNQEILVYMSSTAKSRDKHFVSAQNALSSAIVAVAKSISLTLELEEAIFQADLRNCWEMQASCWQVYTINNQL